MGLLINQKNQFIEFLGPNKNLSELDSSVRSEIDFIYRISDDGNGFIGWNANTGIGLLSVLETRKSI